MPADGGLPRRLIQALVREILLLDASAEELTAFARFRVAGQRRADRVGLRVGEDCPLENLLVDQGGPEIETEVHRASAVPPVTSVRLVVDDRGR